VSGQAFWIVREASIGQLYEMHSDDWRR